MSWDYTYINDLVAAIVLLIDATTEASSAVSQISKVDDRKSNVAPFRVVNIGNSEPAQLLDFVEAFEKSIGIKAIKNLMPMQAGDVPATWADTMLLKALTGYKPNTDLSTGVQKFVSWYREYYNV